MGFQDKVVKIYLEILGSARDVYVYLNTCLDKLNVYAFKLFGNLECL